MQFDIEGHRGWRGAYPENTIHGFIEAVKLGVNTLEMDVVVSKDKQLVVSHDPEMNADICSTPEGKPMAPGDHFKIYNLTYEEIKQFDCGSRGNPRFPDQHKMAAHKPLLVDVIDSVEAYIAAHHLTPVQYNIETKSTPAGDGVDHPKPLEFAGLLYDVVKKKAVLPRVIIQSFDPRTLQAIHRVDPKATLALLIANPFTLEHNLDTLGFDPQIYSPEHILVTKKLIKKCHARNIKVIPWTVNDESKMLKLKKMGVDGIISDYPDRAIKALR